MARFDPLSLLIRPKGPGTFEVRSDRSLKLRADGTVEVCGYAPDEVREILAALREHLSLLADMTHEITGRADAVRYVPEGRS